MGAAGVGTVVAASKQPEVASALAAPLEAAWEQLEDSVPVLRHHPKLVLGALAAARRRPGHHLLHAGQTAGCGA